MPGPADQPEIVFRTETLLARAYLGRGSNLCFVVFDPMVDDGTLTRQAFGEGFLASYGYDAVHILSSRNGWYQEPDLPAALMAIKALTRRYERVVTYGSSMGGYAALRFAEAVGARTAIAISPQYSVLPSAAPFEVRWTMQRRAVRWLHERPGDRLSHVEEAIVFYDNRWLDGFHAEAIRRDLPHMTAVAMPYAGHPVSTVLVDIGAMKGTILDAAHGRFDKGALLAALRQHRRRSGQFLLTLARRQPAWRLHLKARLAQRACELAPDAPGALSYAGLAHECIGQHERALAFHSAAIAVPGPGYIGLRMSRLLWRTGRRSEAREVFERALQDLSQVEPMHEVGARMAIIDGDFDEGFKRLIAIATIPGKAHRSMLARALRRVDWAPMLHSNLLRALVRWIAFAEMQHSVLNPDNILKELAEADRS